MGGRGQKSKWIKGYWALQCADPGEGQIVVRHETVRMTDAVSDRLSVPTGMLRPGGNAPPRGGRDKLCPHVPEGDK